MLAVMLTLGVVQPAGAASPPPPSGSGGNTSNCQATFDGVRIAGQYGIVSDGDGDLWGVNSYSRTAARLITDGASFTNSDVNLSNEYGQYGVVSDDTGTLWGVYNDTVIVFDTPGATFTDSAVRIAARSGILSDDEGGLWTVSASDGTATKVTTSGSTFKENGGVRISDGTTGVVSDDNGVLWNISAYDEDVVKLDTPGATFKENGGVRLAGNTGLVVSDDEGALWMIDVIDGSVVASKVDMSDSMSTFRTNDGVRLGGANSAFISDDAGVLAYFYADNFGGKLTIPEPAPTFTSNGGVRLSTNNYGFVSDDGGVLYAVATETNGQGARFSGSEIDTGGATFRDSAVRVGDVYGIVSDDNDTLWGIYSYASRGTAVHIMSDATFGNSTVRITGQYGIVSDDDGSLWGVHVAHNDATNTVVSTDTKITTSDATFGNSDVRLDGNTGVVSDNSGTLWGVSSNGTAIRIDASVDCPPPATPDITVGTTNETGFSLVTAGDHTVIATITNSGDDNLKDIKFGSNDDTLTWTFTHGGDTNLTVDDLADITLEPGDTITGTATVTVAKGINSTSQSAIAAVATATGVTSRQSVSGYSWAYLHNLTVGFTKTDGDGTGLNGAHFSLYALPDDVSSTVIDPDNLPEDARCLVSDVSNPTVELDGITSANTTYRLVETVAPDGYVTPGGQWNIVINVSGSTPTPSSSTIIGVEVPDHMQSGFYIGRIDQVSDNNGTQPPAFSGNMHNDTLTLANVPTRTLPSSGSGWLAWLLAMGALSVGVTSYRLTTRNGREGVHKV